MTARKLTMKDYNAALELVLDAHAKWAKSEYHKKRKGRRLDLSEADLSGAYLYGAYLRNADLQYVDLGGADLRDGMLDDANLTRVTLGDSDLRGADIINANLEGADLTNANLRYVKGLYNRFMRRPAQKDFFPTYRGITGNTRT